MGVKERDKKKGGIPIPPSAVYMSLVKKFPLRPITTEEENDCALEIMHKLMKADNKGELTADEQAYMNVLSGLIQNFETEHYDLGPGPTQAEILKYLMEQHGLKQSDLEDELGAQATVSNVLRGKRKLTVTQIRRLADRFHVSPAVFIGPAQTKADS